jgi:hypothetical protein
MRIELIAAYGVGVALPVLEAMRRRTRFDPLTPYVDDFIAGGLLLYAARATSRGRPAGPVLLVIAWAVLCGGLYYSFFGQLESREPRDISGLSNAAVVVIKGVLYAIALVCLFLSARAVIRRPGA